MNLLIALEKPDLKVNTCTACGGLYYVHIDYDGTGHLEIESCDMCCPSMFDDDDAALLHRMVCGCPVHEISEGRVG